MTYKFLIIFLELCLTFFIASIISTKTYAATGTIRPNGDSVTQWTSTGTNHYDQINEIVTQPTAGNTSNNVNNGGSSSNVDRFQMQSISNITSVSAITVWVYAYSTRSNSSMSVDLYYDGATQQTGAVSLGTSYNWYSATFTGLTLSQSQLDGLEVIITGDAGGRTYYVATLYADVTYTIFTVDIVDNSGNSVSSPSITMNSTNFSFNFQTTTGTFGTSTQKIRVNNGTANPSWNLTLAASGGSTALWTGTGSNYDYNDPTSQAGDGSDGDSVGGQMTVNAAVGAITPQGGCATTGLTQGTSASFDEPGAVNSITILSAGATANTNCYWDFTGISISQSIPTEQPVDNYSINMTLTLTAI